SAPGWLNLRAYQPEKQVKYDKESLVLHEAVPGQIFQGSLARSLKELPEFRKFYGNSAYAEGWALYAESLGSQLGVYKDPYSRFGQLASEGSGGAAGNRYWDSLDGMDAGAGTGIFEGACSDASAVGGGSLHQLASAGAFLQDGAAEDRGAAQESGAKAGAKI